MEHPGIMEHPELERIHKDHPSSRPAFAGSQLCLWKCSRSAGKSPLLLVFGVFHVLNPVLAAELCPGGFYGGIPPDSTQAHQSAMIPNIPLFGLMQSLKRYKSGESIYLIPQAPLRTNKNP